MNHSDEIGSVYVRNLPPTVSEAESKNFGRTASGGVVIHNRKDIGVCYAFVGFEDMAGARNAVKAGSAIVAGQRVYVEERRPISNIPFQAGRGRGIGRGSFLTDAPRGRFGSQSFASGGGYDGLDRDYGRPRGTGYFTPNSRQDWFGSQSFASGGGYDGVYWGYSRPRGIGYFMLNPQDCFGSQSFASEGGYDGLYWGYSRPRGTGYFTPNYHQDRTFTGNKSFRSEQDQSD